MVPALPMVGLPLLLENDVRINKFGVAFLPPRRLFALHIPFKIKKAFHADEPQLDGVCEDAFATSFCVKSISNRPPIPSFISGK